MSTNHRALRHYKETENFDVDTGRHAGWKARKRTNQLLLLTTAHECCCFMNQLMGSNVKLSIAINKLPASCYVGVVSYF